jgi:hypothetical protein
MHIQNMPRYRNVIEIETHLSCIVNPRAKGDRHEMIAVAQAAGERVWLSEVRHRSL